MARQPTAARAPSSTISRAGAGASRANGNGSRNGNGNGHGSGTNGARSTGHGAMTAHDLDELHRGLEAARLGDFTVRLSRRDGLVGEVFDAYNDVIQMNARMTEELGRIARIVGREGKMTERLRVADATGSWRTSIDAVNSLTDDLVRPTTEVARVIVAVAEGDLSQKMALKIEGQPVKGEFLRIGTAVNSMVDQLSSFAAEVSRVAKEVGTDGKLGGQAEVEGVSGIWKDLTENVNFMAGNLTSQVRNIAQVATAVANGDLSQKISVDAKGEILELKNTINTMVEQLRAFADEVTRVAREVGTEGKLGGQAEVPGVAGTWKDLTDNVNFMAGNLTSQVRNIAQVTTAVARGDLSQKITVDVKGEILELKNTINTMVDQLSSFADEVTRVAREVGTEGKLGGQAQVKGVSGTWRDLTENVNQLAGNLTDQVRNIAQVTTAVAQGDLSQKITVDAKGEVAALADTINTMVDQLRAFAAEVTRVAREVGTEGRLGGQAEVAGVSGTWKDLTENVNQLAGNLTAQVRNIAQVTTAVAQGDLSQKITVDAKGEVAALADTINTMVDQLRAFAAEVTRVAREVGTEGNLGGQAEVEGVSGTWKDLTENVNFMAGNLTAQVRAIAQVTTAVANGDLSKTINVDARGEILELKDTINTMVAQLSSFAAEVTRVAKEVGTEGKLGGQAKVEGVSGTWKGLTENVNQLAGNLTTQVRAIAEVSTAVTRGDLTRTIAVEAQGEVAELKDNINQMIGNLRETTQKNTETDWLKTNLARISGMMQGQRDIAAVSRMIMSELTPLVGAQHGAFFLAEPKEGETPLLRLIASYGYKPSKGVARSYAFGETLVGQAAVEKQTILLSDPPGDYIKISSGLGEARPASIIVMPVLFEEQVLGVIELASFQPFSDINRTFLNQLMATIGVVLNTIIANMRTEELLAQSQRLAQELQSQSEELQAQQEELKRSNAELEAQAKSLTESEELLHQQQQELQQTNREIEAARRGLEEKAEQLALSSKYKSEFLANMSHELRTPLNSVLILAKMLADNPEGNLTDKQRQSARTIHAGGSDLLSLISDILDLSKVEAGRMDVNPADIRVGDIRDYVDLTFRPVASEKSLNFDIEIAEGVVPVVTTDEQRLQQILKNLLSNAFKFTKRGGVTLRIAPAPPNIEYVQETLRKATSVIAFSVTDTGIGVAPDKLRLIFEAFQQADGTTSRKYGGTGLGLSISREIARLLGAEIRVESTPGEGSSFTLYLPTQYRPVEEVVIATAQPAAETDDREHETRVLTASSVVAPMLAGQPLLGDAGQDDRDQLQAGDRVLLTVVDAPERAAIALTEGRAQGFKVLVALREEFGLELARQFRPDAIVLDLENNLSDGMTLLVRLKHEGDTRHIPVCIIAGATHRQQALGAGALAHIDSPLTGPVLASTLQDMRAFIDRAVRHLLLVDDDPVLRASVAQLLGGGEGVEVTAVGSGEAALAELAKRQFDCMVLDLGLPEMTGFALMEKLKKQKRFRSLPVIVFTGREFSHDDERELRKYAQSIIVKDAQSLERLLDETALFLHRPEVTMPAEHRQMIEALHRTDAIFENKKILIVDDDVRNVFALTSALESHGMEVVFAENGKEGIERLVQNPDSALVLMDVMMPEMDGYETTRAIRGMEEFQRLPIIALTAKAMKGDREKSIEAGASDYITKPVDIDTLLSLMRVWLHR
jgi:signal transduction histidine kinase/HAMP domain-containing protein/CheY-like chemotaxis protein